MPAQIDNEPTAARRCLYFEVPLNVAKLEQYVIAEAIVSLRYVSGRSRPSVFEEIDKGTLPSEPDSGSLSKVDAPVHVPDRDECNALA
jgi:hypothetical protein